MTRLRILVTGSRAWDDPAVIRYAIDDALASHATMAPPVLIHGAAAGADSIADQYWRYLRHQWPGLDRAERYPSSDFPSPRARNQHMVDLGATVCLAFALSWRSGTGMCARMARAAGIPVRDYGVDTSPEARP
jgi:hypothetical protein